MHIIGKITGIKYFPQLIGNLTTVDVKFFDINSAPTTCLLLDNQYAFAISKWVSPKRTRSYPYQRVYDSLHTPKKITVIPIIKDEGAKGDRDFLQWDTVSLMSLLDVFVIFAYYEQATINPRNSQKITSQQFNNSYIVSKINAIAHYHSSALHWNLEEINSLDSIINEVKKSYNNIQKTTGVALHNVRGIDNFQEKISKDTKNFKEFSRNKARKAQQREFATIQPKESLSTLSKAKITIFNYLGGQYFFTVDEVNAVSGVLELIESKHSKSTLLPSVADIKDGLLKMILYCNLQEVTINQQLIKSQAILKLTSSQLKGSVRSSDSANCVDNFLTENNFSENQKRFINTLFQEAVANNFIVTIAYSQ